MTDSRWVRPIAPLEAEPLGDGRWLCPVFDIEAAAYQPAEFAAAFAPAEHLDALIAAVAAVCAEYEHPDSFNWSKVNDLYEAYAPFDPACGDS